MTTNKKVLAWIDEMAKMTQPDNIVWIDGTEAQAEALRAEACSTGEIIKLNQETKRAKDADAEKWCDIPATDVNNVSQIAVWYTERARLLDEEIGVLGGGDA